MTGSARVFFVSRHRCPAGRPERRQMQVNISAKCITKCISSGHWGNQRAEAHADLAGEGTPSAPVQRGRVFLFNLWMSLRKSCHPAPTPLENGAYGVGPPVDRQGGEYQGISSHLHIFVSATLCSRWCPYLSPSPRIPILSESPQLCRTAESTFSLPQKKNFPRSELN